MGQCSAAPSNLLTYASIISKMMFVFAMVSMLCMLLPEADAGCGAHGCCYCGSQTGEVIYTGTKAPNCQQGYQCHCLTQVTEDISMESVPMGIFLLLMSQLMGRRQVARLHTSIHLIPTLQYQTMIPCFIY